MCWGVEKGDRMGTSLFFKVFSKMGTILQVKKSGILPNAETDVLDWEAAGN